MVCGCKSKEAPFLVFISKPGLVVIPPDVNATPELPRSPQGDGRRKDAVGKAGRGFAGSCRCAEGGTGRRPDAQLMYKQVLLLQAAFVIFFFNRDNL